ncbi:hypothetical protein VNO80_06369 [Phaseolus coccineus]|uniref:Uncharacterized protein n=1 Tax=Phaseolus coccineus TaxID=3886 RepID=A0AAN9NHE1_PHACN
MDRKKHYWCRQRRPKFRAADPRNMFKIIHVKNSNKIWSDLEELQVRRPRVGLIFLKGMNIWNGFLGPYLLDEGSFMVYLIFCLE